MEIILSQDIKMKQRLMLTPMQQHSLNILQMPLIILCENISKELNENPFLEIENEDKYSISNSEYKNKSPLDTQDKFNFLQEKKTLKDHLIEQAGYLKESPNTIKIIYYIIENIDKKGYFHETASELAKELKIHEKLADYAIKKVQDFTPDGVCARNLEECLCIQLRKKNYTDEKLYELVNNYLLLMSKNKIKELACKLNLKSSTVLKYCNIIKSLEPKPSRGFYNETNVYIIPEAFINIMDSEIIISINDDFLPDIKLSKYYKDIMKNVNDDKTKEYLNNKLNSAKNLLISLNNRRKTLTKILEHIAIIQNDYFLKGDKYLKQMSFKDIAQRIGINESTVSRAIKDKFIQTPVKIIKIKDMFSTGYDTINISSKMLKNEIKLIIQNENKEKPLSDSEIKCILENQNYNISRRTVAKYRESLGILSSSGRKQYIT